MPGSKLLQSKDEHLQDEANEDDQCSHERKSSSKRLEKTLVKDDGDHIQDTVRKRTLEYTSRTDDS